MVRPRVEALVVVPLTSRQYKVDFVYPKGINKDNFNWFVEFSPNPGYGFWTTTSMADPRKMDSEGYIPVTNTQPMAVFRLRGVPK